MINSFRGENYFLSNFYTAEVSYNGITYLNNEAAFQAQKTLDLNEREKFKRLPPNSAKALGRKVKLRPDWEEVKDKIMFEICLAKFTNPKNSELKQKLLDTGTEYLEEEGSTWGDMYWGTVDGIGRNRLGKILMEVRKRISKESS